MACESERVTWQATEVELETTSAVTPLLVVADAQTSDLVIIEID
jgi:hypothetical protein